MGACPEGHGTRHGGSGRTLRRAGTDDHTSDARLGVRRMRSRPPGRPRGAFSGTPHPTQRSRKTRHTQRRLGPLFQEDCLPDHGVPQPAEPIATPIGKPPPYQRSLCAPPISILSTLYLISPDEETHFSVISYTAIGRKL